MVIAATSATDALFSFETLRVILVFFGGIFATVIGVYLREKINRFTELDTELFKPLHNEVVKASNGDFPYTDGEFQSKWGELEPVDREKFNQETQEYFEEYQELLRDLETLKQYILDAIVKEELEDGDILPDNMTKSSGTSTTVNIETVDVNFKWNEMGSVKSHTTAISWIGQNANTLITARSEADLQEELQEYSDTDVDIFNQWDETEFSAIFELVDIAAQNWAEDNGFEDRFEHCDQIVKTSELLSNNISKRRTLWRHLFNRH